MQKWRISYIVANRPKKEIIVEFPVLPVTTREIARAIIEYEFEEVVAPFGLDEGFTTKQALRRFAISDVRISAFVAGSGLGSD